MSHQIYNHIDGISQIAEKNRLHKNMILFGNLTGQSDIMPETYIIDITEVMKGSILQHEQFKMFEKSFTKDSWWIIKPGEDANRGNGIKVFNSMGKVKNFVLNEFNGGAK